MQNTSEEPTTAIFSGLDGSASEEVQSPPKKAAPPTSASEQRPTQTAEDLPRAPKKGEEKTRTQNGAHESFDDMGLQEGLLRGIYAFGYERPSAIQQRAIVPCCSGRDVIAQAQSGTGKTATFSIAVIQQLDLSCKRCQVSFENVHAHVYNTRGTPACAVTVCWIFDSRPAYTVLLVKFLLLVNVVMSGRVCVRCFSGHTYNVNLIAES